MKSTFQPKKIIFKNKKENFVKIITPILDFNMQSLTCSKHSNTYIALCIQCNEGLCLECIFDHKSFKDHEFEKLSKLKEKWVLDLNKFSSSVKEPSTPINKGKEKTSMEILKEALLKLEKLQNEIKNKIDEYFSEYKVQLTNLLKEQSISELKDIPVFNFEYPPKSFQSKKEELSFFIQRLETGAELEIFNLLKYFNENKYKESLDLENSKNKRGSSDSLDIRIKTPIHLFYNESILSKMQDLLTQNINFSYDFPTVKRLLSIEERKMPSILPWFFENTSFLLIYDIKEKKILQYQLKDFLIPFNHRCIVTKNNNIYLLGGMKPDTEAPTNELFLFDAKNNSMRAKFNMKEARFGHALCYLSLEKEEYIFCIGGRSEENRLNSVERYNINENSWKKLQKLNFSRVGACACANKRNIYVFGGLTEKDAINKNIEVYSLNEDKWDFLDVKNSICFDPCIDSACLFLNDNNILLLGGAKKENNDVYFKNNLNFYNLEQNTIFMNSGFKEDFPFHVLGDLVTIYDKSVYMMVKLRSESKKYGPFQKSIITFDFNRNQWRFDQLVEYDLNEK